MIEYAHHAADISSPSPGRTRDAQRLRADIVNLFNDRYFDEEKAARVAELLRRHVTRWKSASAPRAARTMNCGITGVRKRQS